MAKKRRKEPDEEFELPEFDEATFLKKEILGAKVMILTVILAIAAAVLSYILTLAGVVIVAFFAGLALIFLIKYFVKIFNIEVENLERKDWLGQGFTYFFAWLAIWVLLLNVPFSDVTQPNMTIFVEDIEVPNGGTVHVSNSTANITVSAYDNAGIKGVWIQNPSGSAPVLMSQQPGSLIWFYQVSITGSTLGVTIIVEDVSGNAPVTATITIAKQG